MSKLSVFKITNIVYHHQSIYHTRTMEIELNGAETTPILKPEEVFDQTQTKIIRNNIADILSMLTRRTKERVAILSTMNKGTSPVGSSSSSSGSGSSSSSGSGDTVSGVHGAKEISASSSSKDPLKMLYE